MTMYRDRRRRQQLRLRAGAIGRTPLLVLTSVIAGSLLLGALVILGPMLSSGPGNANNTTNGNNSNGSGIEPLLIPDDPNGDPTIVVGEGMETDGIVRNMERAHIEIADENGQLNQIFEYDRLDTLSDGFNEVLKPSVVAAVSETTLLRIRANQARVTMIEQRPQSGVLEGNVVIELFDGLSIRRAIPSDARPTMRITTDTLSFDAALYRAETDAQVVFRSANLGLSGTGLSLVYNEIQQRIESLEIEKPDAIVYRAPTNDRVATATTNTSTSTTPVTPPTVDASSSDRPANIQPATVGTNGNGATEPASPDEATLPPPTWYTLDLDKNVRIVRGQLGTKDGIEVSGDHLTAWFALDDDQWDAMLGHAGRRAAPRLRIPNPTALAQRMWNRVHDELASVPIAQIMTTRQDPADLLDPFTPLPDDVIITCDGRLRIAPVANDLPPLLTGTDDLMATIDGAPTRVRLELGEATCSQLAYHRSANTLEMHPDENHIVDLAVDDLGGVRSHDPATTFVINFNDANARMIGPGLATTTDNNTDESSTIAWRDAFELRFSGSPDADANGEADLGEIESAHFSGLVHVETPDATIDARDTVEAFFVKPNDTADPVLHRIRADGRVEATSTEGQVTGDTVVMAFKPDSTGDAIIDTAEVIGNARMTDGEQSLRARHIIAQFVPVADETSDDLEVSHLTASNRVVMDLQDGARVFADRLDADFPTDQVVISGDRVLAHVDDAIILGTQITIDRAFSETGMLVTVPGSGTFAYLDSTDPNQPAWSAPDLMIQAIERRMTKRHDEDADAAIGQAMRVTWADTMTYTVDTGLAEVLGNVLAEGSAAPNEYDTIEAHRLIIELTEDDANWSARSGDAPIASMAGNRTLRRLEAYGNDQSPAAIFAGRYLDHTRRHPEMQLSIRGPFIEYQHASNRLDVHGEGTLLVVDKRTREQAQASGTEPSAAASSGVASFSGRGETLFKWKQDMTLDGLRNEMRMHGDVSLLHRPPNQGVTRLTAQRLNAGLMSDGPVDAFNLSQRPDMKLKFAMAEDQVVVISPDNEIMCDSFAYDAVALLATIQANGDDLVTMVKRGSPTPIRAGRIIWDLYTDSIKVDRVGTVFAPDTSGGG